MPQRREGHVSVWSLDHTLGEDDWDSQDYDEISDWGRRTLDGEWYQYERNCRAPYGRTT